MRRPPPPTPKAATALLDQTAADLPDAVLSGKVGAVDGRGRRRHRRLDRDVGPRRRPRLELPGIAAAAEGRPGVAGRRRTHGRASRSWGRGSTSSSTRSLPERAAITDADGAPLFAPTEVVNVGVDTSKVTDLPALAEGWPAATGASAEKIVANVQAAPAGQFVPVITLRRPRLRGHPRAGLRPAGRRVPDHHPAAGALAAASPPALLGRVGDGDRGGDRGVAGRRIAALRRR